MELRGGRLISWSGDSTLRLWASDGQPLSVLEQRGHGYAVTGARGGVLGLAQGSATLDTRGAGVSRSGTLCGEELRDGRLLSWSRDGTLRLWTAQGRQLKVLEGHAYGVRGALELRGGRLLSWAGDHTLRLWTADGQLLCELCGHTDAVTGAAELRDGRLLSWAGELHLVERCDSTLCLWTGDGQLLQVLERHTNWAWERLELRDGRLLFWSHSDPRPCLRSAVGWPLQLLDGHKDGVEGVLELRDGRLLSWSHDRTSRLWTAGGRPLQVLEEHEYQLWEWLELPDGRLLSWSRHDTTLRLWSSHAHLLDIFLSDAPITHCMVTANGTVVATTSRGGILWLGLRVEGRQSLSTATRQTIIANMREAARQLKPWAVAPCVHLGLYDEVRSLLFSGRWLAGALAARGVYAVMADYEVLLDEGRESAQLVLAALALSAHVLTEHPDQLTLQLEGRLHGYRSESRIEELLRTLPWSPFEPLNAALTPPGGSLQCTLGGHIDEVQGALALRDGRLLSWSLDCTLRLWSTQGQPLQILDGHTAVVMGVLELRDGRLLSWSADHTLRLWSSEGQPLQVLEGARTLHLASRQFAVQGHADAVLGALELRDGRLVSWSNDRTLRLWASDGQPLQTLVGHTGWVEGALELRDGRLLSWSRDSTLRLWTADGQPLLALEGHTGWVEGALELRDGRLLSWSANPFSSIKDHRLLLWSAGGQLLQVLDGHADDVQGSLELQDGRLLSWSADHTLRLWTVGGQPRAVLKRHTAAVNGAVQLRDGRLLSWSEDRTLRLWSTNGRPLQLLEGQRQGVRGALELRDGRLLSWSADGTLRLWTAHGQPLQVLIDTHHTCAERWSCGTADCSPGRTTECPGFLTMLCASGLSVAGYPPRQMGTKAGCKECWRCETGGCFLGRGTAHCDCGTPATSHRRCL